jgi:hypothetical protein
MNAHTKIVFLLNHKYTFKKCALLFKESLMKDLYYQRDLPPESKSQLNYVWLFLKLLQRLQKNRFLYMDVFLYNLDDYLC